MYTFLSASTHRWSILKDNLGGDLIVKNLSQTRWSARAEAVKALKDGFSKIKLTLETIEDTNLKARDSKRIGRTCEKNVSA